MDSQAITDVIRELDRQAGDVAGRPRQNVYDVVRQTIDVLRTRGERPIETTFWPVGGPEYTGRA